MIFDYIALACREILNNTDDRFFEEYQAISSSYINQLKREMSQQVPSYFKDGAYRMLDKNDLYHTGDFLGDFSAMLTSALAEKNYDKALFFIQNICSGFARYITNLTYIPDDYRSFDYLNTNSSETKIIVLPKFRADWQHSNMWKTFDYGLNNYLQNIYIIDIASISGKYKIKNYILSYGLFQEALNNGKLLIGVSPITCKSCINPENIETREVDGKGYFSLKELSNKNELQNNLKSIYQKAQKNGINILVFPEMLGIEGQEQVIEDIVKESGELNPQITVLPSIWKNRENCSQILIGAANDPVLQRKSFRFPYQNEKGDTFLEDLRLDGEIDIHIFHADKIGRIVVAICKDLLMKKHLDFLIEELKASVILVPSFSTGDYPFEMISYEGFPYDCNIVWINSCAAEHLLNSSGKTLDNIGLFYRPSRDGTQDCIRKFKKEGCTGQCSECFFTMEININIRGEENVNS